MKNCVRCIDCKHLGDKDRRGSLSKKGLDFYKCDIRIKGASVREDVIDKFMKCNFYRQKGIRNGV